MKKLDTIIKMLILWLVLVLAWEVPMAIYYCTNPELVTYKSRKCEWVVVGTQIYTNCGHKIINYCPYCAREFIVEGSE